MYIIFIDKKKKKISLKKDINYIKLQLHQITLKKKKTFRKTMRYQKELLFYKKKSVQKTNNYVHKVYE